MEEGQGKHAISREAVAKPLPLAELMAQVIKEGERIILK
jgi:hypothetical protein